MKKLIREKLLKGFFLIMLIMTGLASWSQSIWTNDITGTNPNTSNPYTTGDNKNANITVSGIGRGAGISGTSANNRYNTTGYTTSANAVVSNEYLEFTLTPNANYKISFVSFVYTGQASGTGPTQIVFRSSIDNYASNIGSATITGTTISLSGAAYQNRTVATTFRLYPYGTPSNGSAGTFSVNDFTFNGTVAASATPPTVTTNTAATAVTAYTATTGGNVTAAGTASVTARGVVWTTSTTDATVGTNMGMTTDGTGTGSFTSGLTNLTPATTYYYRAYATSTAGTSYGTEYSFTTQAIPTVTTTNPATAITINSATAGGNVTAQGTSAVTARGVVWTTSSVTDPTIITNSGITTDGTGTGTFASGLTGLSVNTTYYYRAYATNTQGTAYGAKYSFTTLNIIAPTVTTTAFNSQDDAGVNTASLNGGISNNGGAAVVRRGFIWNATGTNLTVDSPGATTVDDSDDTDAAFTMAISGLDPNSQYYYTAFANNGTATGYGATNNFYTKAATPGVPTVNNATVSSLTVSNDANGNPTTTEYVIRVDTPVGLRYVNSLGELQAEEMWLAGSLVSSPVIVTGLAIGTPYTFDVKARNGSGIETPYSSTTTMATVTPTTPYFTLNNSDLAFGPLCINTTSASGQFTFLPNNLPLNQDIIINGPEGFTFSTTEEGVYSTEIEVQNINAAITIYVKFAPTAVQAYGEPATIDVSSANTDTLNVHATGEGVNTATIVTTGTSSTVTVTGATLSGHVEQGCSSVTAYGIEYSTTAAFVDGTGTNIAGANLTAEAFTVDVTGLTACTTYYYKAYVTDATGTYYGAEDTFDTETITNPAATNGTNVTQTSFTANWDAEPGATGYYLDVSTDPGFETVILTEDFSKIIAVDPVNDTSKSSPFDLYTHTAGWTGQLLYLTETGNARFGNSGNGGILITPALNLSVNSGTITVSFRAKYNGTDAKSVQVQHAVNGSSTYTAVQAAWPLTADFATYSTTITNGSSNSKVRFFPIGAAPSRFHIDDIKVYYSNLLTGYNNLNVTTGNSHAITGLNPDTQYYYRVRAYGTNCTSGNSNTIEVQTLKYLTAGETNLAFGEVCTNATETGSFTFTGANMANATLNISALSGYTYSLTEDGEYTPTLQLANYNGDETTVYVKFSPSAVQAYNGNITLQGATPYEAAILTVPVTGAGIFTAAAATAEAAENITMTSASIDATSTPGNCTTNTGYGVEYSTVNNFANGTGTQVAGTWIDENGNYTVSISGLLPCKIYYYKAYTTTSGATVYSAQRNFTTNSIGEVTALDGENIKGETFTANWETVPNATGYRIDVSEYPEFGIGNYGTDLIISEYIEGTSNNKAIEIYNGTGAAVNLSSYSIRQQAEGAGTFGSPASQYTISLPDVMLPAGGVVIAKSAQATLLTVPSSQPANLVVSLLYADTGGRTVHFTGNDPIGLFKGNTMIDVIGSGSTDYGTNKNIRRKASVLSPSATYNASQWTSEAIGSINISYLGAHDYDGGMVPSFVDGYENLDVPGGGVSSVEVEGLTPFTKYYYRVRAYAAECATGNSDVIEVTTRGKVTWKLVSGIAKWIPEFYADGTTPLVIDETVDTAIEADYTLGEDNNFSPKSITITGGIFTVTGGNTFTVANEITNNAGAQNFVVQNNANVIQGGTENHNTGAITVYRNSSPLFRNDYVMWSSPVAGQDLVNFSPNTMAGRYYEYSPEPGTEPGQENGLYVHAAGTFATAKGYLIRMPNAGYNYDTQSITGTINGTASQYNNGEATMVFNGKFTGVPNNGDIAVTLSNTAGSYHLIGNPYPSPLSLTAFIAKNEDVITGTVYVWRKKNASTGTSAYVTMNSTGQYADNGEPNTDTNPLGVIRTGQGFIVQMTENPASSEVVFNNEMRSENTSNQFFRNVNASQQQPESHGVYLNLTNASGVYSQMFTGYIEGATDGRDNGIDSEYINDKPTVLSTVMAGTEYVIHGRALPFNPQNTEPLQLRTVTAGQYTIAIDRTEGSFGTQDIYLQDNMLGVVHNLKITPYTFTTAAGTFTDRFEVVYSPNGTLATENPVADDGSIIVYKQDNTLKINSMKEEISSVTVIDIRGRKLHEESVVNAHSTEIKGLPAVQQILIVKVKTVNGAVINRKIVF